MSRSTRKLGGSTIVSDPIGIATFALLLIWLALDQGPVLFKLVKKRK